MPNNGDAKVLQVLRRQAWKDRPVDLILAEGLLVPFEAKAPQPTADIHESAPSVLLRRIILPVVDVCNGSLSPFSRCQRYVALSPESASKSGRDWDEGRVPFSPVVERRRWHESRRQGYTNGQFPSEFELCR